MSATSAEPVPAHRFRPTWLVLGLLVVGLAFAVRADRLGFGVLSADESFSWRLTRYPVSDLVRRTGADVHPPFYYLLLKPWVAVGVRRRPPSAACPWCSGCWPCAGKPAGVDPGREFEV